MSLKIKNFSGIMVDGDFVMFPDASSEQVAAMLQTVGYMHKNGHRVRAIKLMRIFMQGSNENQAGLRTAKILTEMASEAEVCQGDF